MPEPRVRLLLAAVLGLAAALAAPAVAPAAVDLVPVASGLAAPVYVASPPDGSQRLFVVEQGGAIKVLPPGGGVPGLFLDVSPLIATTGEQGLLGLAFHPDFAANRRLFVSYTRKSGGAVVLAEYLASPSNPNVALTPGRVLLTIPHPKFTNHNGGWIGFGLDGFLYVSVGDGGSANDPNKRAQNVQTLLGKILRLDVDPGGSKRYVSPRDNPFVGRPGRDEIFAVGFRNPWRASVDRVTGALYVGDVGQGSREEIDVVARGGNYGWRVFEGDLCTGLDPERCDDGGFTGPVVSYPTHSGARCAVTGGYVYRGSLGTFPPGTYVFGDYCSGEIFRLQAGAMQLVLDTGLRISSFGEDQAGELYVVDHGGAVHRLVLTLP